MIPSLIVIGLAFTWLLYESDWMRVRLLVGIIKEPVKTIKLWQYRNTWIYGITNRENYSPYRVTKNDNAITLFHAGIEEPICGWDWILSHEHPIIENRIEIIAHNCKHNIHLCDNPEVDYGRIMKELCQVAFKANIRRRNGHKPNKRKAKLTFNPNYKLVASKARRCN